MNQGDWMTVGSVVLAIGPTACGIVWFLRVSGQREKK